ncbi:MAG: hypothetical protein J6M07_10245 [Ruminococcus sp.]|nr:hypothetical protein [Ruminococcus sp.]MBQ5317188.1 hypothetical protein [Oscillospiraceae bacterium]
MATDVSVMRLRQSEINKRIELLQAQLKNERAAYTAESTRRLKDLTRGITERIEAHDSQTDSAYRKALERHTSETEKALQEKLSALRTEYDRLSSEMTEQLAAEQKEREELLLMQEKFEEAYRSRLEFAKGQALEVQSRFTKKLTEVISDVPLEWFLPGHLDLYRRRADEIDRWIRNGLYESAAGIGDDLLMQLSFDTLETEERFGKWSHWHELLKAVIKEEEQMFTAAHRLPEDMPLFGAYLKIQDLRLSDEILDKYTDGGYSAMHREYDMTARIFEQGIPDTEEDIRHYMIENPEKSDKADDLMMYEMIQAAVDRQKAERKLISTMHSRMRAWNERLEIYKDVRSALAEAGCRCRLSDSGDTHIITFSDDMDVHGFELILVPVLRRQDEQWINLVSCYVPDGIGKERYDAVRSALAQVITARGIDIDYRRTDEQDMQEKIHTVCNDKIMLVNGRLN